MAVWGLLTHKSLIIMLKKNPPSEVAGVSLQRRVKPGLDVGGGREEEGTVLAGSAFALCVCSSSAVEATTTQTGPTACGSDLQRPTGGKCQTAAVRR